MGATIRFFPILLLALCLASGSPRQQYIDGKRYAACHPNIYASYQFTGMARSFSKAAPGESVADVYNKASDPNFDMPTRDGKYFERRRQIGLDGKESNADEAKVDFIMGRGDLARTYLHSERGVFIEMPLAWYSEKGGYRAMNPGYNAAHPPAHPDIPADSRDGPGAAEHFREAAKSPDPRIAEQAARALRQIGVAP